MHATVPGVMYARMDVGGAYRWDAAKDVWVQMLTASNVPAPNQNPGDYSVESIATAPSDSSIVYLAVGNDSNPSDSTPLAGTGRVLRSADGGHTWTTSTHRWFVSGNEHYRTGTERLAVDPADAKHVVFGTRREGLWQSRDGGDSWSQVPVSSVPAGLSDHPTDDQAGVGFVTFGSQDATSPAPLYVGVANVGTFASADNGASWKQVETLKPGAYPSGGVIVDHKLFVAIETRDGSNGAVTTFDPATNTWKQLPLPTDGPFWVFAIDPHNAKHIVLTDDAVRNGHLWTSSDGGATWSDHDIALSSPKIPWLAQTDLAGYMSTGRLAFDSSTPSRLWFAEGMSVWSTDDVDASEVLWQSNAVGMEELVASGMVVPPGGVPNSAVADRQGFHYDALTSFPTHTLVDPTFVGGTSIDYSGGHPSDMVWVGAEYQRYYDPARQPRGASSSDGGRTWTEFSRLVPDMFGGEVAISATDPSTIVWLPTYYLSPSEFRDKPRGLYVSSDGGHSWDHQGSVGGLNSFHTFLWWFTRHALAADKVDGSFYLMSADQHFFTSDDGARTWIGAQSPPCVEANACHVYGDLQAVPGEAGHLWASVGVGGLYTTNDKGQTPWHRLAAVDEAQAIGFGAALLGSATPTAYMYGRANGDQQLGVWRSTDDGATWTLLGHYPLGLYDRVQTIAGDPNVAGRVYVGFAGSGFAYGDDPTLGATHTTTTGT